MGAMGTATSSDLFTLTMRALMAAGALLVALFGWTSNRTLTGIDSNIQRIETHIDQQWKAIDEVKNIAVSTQSQVGQVGVKVDDLKDRAANLDTRVQRLETQPAAAPKLR